MQCNRKPTLPRRSRKLTQIVAEHDTEGAHTQLAVVWKAWLAEEGAPAEGQAGAGSCVVAVGSIEVLD
jgi:hypothetical protein